MTLLKADLKVGTTTVAPVLADLKVGTTTVAPVLADLKVGTTTVAPVLADLKVGTTTVAPVLADLKVGTTTAAPVLADLKVGTTTAAPVLADLKVGTTTVAPVLADLKVGTTTVAPVLADLKVGTTTVAPVLADLKVGTTTAATVLADLKVGTTTVAPVLADLKVGTTTVAPVLADLKVGTTTAATVLADLKVGTTTVAPVLADLKVGTTTVAPVLADLKVGTTTVASVQRVSYVVPTFRSATTAASAMRTMVGRGVVPTFRSATTAASAMRTMVGRGVVPTFRSATTGASAMRTMVGRGVVPTFRSATTAASAMRTMVGRGVVPTFRSATTGASAIRTMVGRGVVPTFRSATTGASAIRTMVGRGVVPTFRSATTGASAIRTMVGRGVVPTFRSALALACLALLSACSPQTYAVSDPTKVEAGIVFDIGGKDDRSFNAAAWNGMKCAETGTLPDGAPCGKPGLGIVLRDVEPGTPVSIEPAMRAFAERKYDVIVGIGFAQAPILDSVAKDYPDIQFAIVDGVSELPNVASIVFKEHEGSYLVGILAAMTSRTGTIGFLGGMDIGLIHRFGKGYEQGARSVNPNIRVLENYVGVTDAAWNNPGRGKELALAQIAKGADVIFTAAGNSGLGAFDAVEEKGRDASGRATHFVIGVDANQNMVKPGFVLTSMIKRVDQAVYQIVKDVTEKRFTSGLHVFGLESEGVGYVVDEYNKLLLSPEAIAAAEDAKRKIIAGEIKVIDAMFQ